jgi:hypothetical protein
VKVSEPTVLAPRVELLWWPGCPSTPRALRELRAIMRELGLDPERIELHEMETDADAVRERFPGSPTIRVDGADADPPPADEPAGLTCRIYRLADGRVSPTPDLARVRAALAAAVKRRTP